MLILVTPCLEKWRQFDGRLKRSHNAGLWVKSSDTARNLCKNVSQRSL